MVRGILGSFAPYSYDNEKARRHVPFNGYIAVADHLDAVVAWRRDVRAAPTISRHRTQWLTVNCVLVNDSRGAVANFCRHWTDEFINGDNDLALAWRDERNISRGPRLSLEAVGGIGAVGIVSVSSVDPRSFVQCRFHPRLDGGILPHGILMGSVGKLGRIKRQEPRDPRARPRTKRGLT